jgi:hypothetical protein
MHLKVSSAEPQRRIDFPHQVTAESEAGSLQPIDGNVVQLY